ncbi:uncharacterized protein LOC126324530 [Schistocerca gregaria]|uniref:uncharacterized protein LOC126324530 n=1 Tax=Schistocerca gregaria TaxID=7010 RepID=UPI00211DD888|nr:uncharacterized protein LOC126324530 [Schistocerca gregaria]
MQPALDIELNQPPEDGITKITFLPQDNLLLASSWDTSVRIYDTLHNSLRLKYNHKASVLDCCFSDNLHLFSAGIDRGIIMFDVAGGTEIPLGSHNEPVRSLVWDPTSNALLSGGWDLTLRVWDPRSQDRQVGCYQQPERVYAMDLTGNYIIVGTAARHVWIWDLRHMNEPVQRRESSLKYQTRCVRAFPDGDGYVLSSTEGRVAMEYIDPSSEVQAKKYIFKCHRVNIDGIDYAYPVNTIAYHPIQGTFATGGGDGHVCIWDGKHKKRLAQLRKYPISISSVDFSSDGAYLAIASSYTFEEGEKDHPPDKIYVRSLNTFM